MEAQKEKQKETPDLPSKELFKKAVDDAQFLVAYAASKCDKYIDDKTLTTLITAKRLMDENQKLDAHFEAEFWLAYQHIWTLVKPVTAESIKANMLVEPPFASKLFKNMPVLSQWVGMRAACKARQTVNRYIAATVSVLLVVLLLQIYWAIGNQLTSQLADLLQRETELSQTISANRQEYNAIEIRFKQNEIDSESFKTSGVYTFYSSPEWERDIQQNVSAKSQLEADLASLKSQIERSSDILLRWSSLWAGLINEEDQSAVAGQKDPAIASQYDFQIASIQRQIDEIDAQLKANPKSSEEVGEARSKIADLQKELVELETNQVPDSRAISKKRSEIDALTNWVNLDSQLKQDKERLDEEKASVLRQQQSANKREASHQAQLAGQFVLVILQSYLLPLLYGILGAGTSILRSLSNEIEKVTFSEEAGIQHLLRISLGGLAGIMVGWFSFLIPNETNTFVGSISPLAIAFLVGYNIELFFSLMDRGLNWVNEKVRQPSSTTEAQQTSDSQKNKPAATAKRAAVTSKANPAKV